MDAPLPSGDYDIVIVGGGVAGTLLAVILGKKTDLQLKIALVDSGAPDIDKICSSSLDWGLQSRRVSAVNFALFKKLEHYFSGNPADIAAPLRDMQVYSPECGGGFVISALDYTEDALAYVVDNLQLTEKLYSLLPDGVNLISHNVDRIKQAGQGYHVHIGKQVLNTKYLIGADGAQSKVRQDLLLPYKTVGQQSVAIGAQLHLPACKDTSKAKQWFLRDGSVLGLLPLHLSEVQTNIMSMVWSLPINRQLRHHENDWFDLLHKQVSLTPQADIFQGMSFLTMPKRWPLNRGYLQTKSLARDFPGLFLIGDAAHVIHPLAGQGLNLGLGDVFQLTQSLQRIFSGEKSLYCESQTYFARRMFEVKNMLTICESFREYFEQQNWVLDQISSWAFQQFNRHSILKRNIVNLMSFNRAIS